MARLAGGTEHTQAAAERLPCALCGLPGVLGLCQCGAQACGIETLLGALGLEALDARLELADADLRQRVRLDDVAVLRDVLALDCG
jgi:hypothetical protein